MVLSGANAAIFVAELENPYPTPPRITVSWEKATDVQKEKLNWFTVNMKKTINADLTVLFLGYVKKIRVKNLAFSEFKNTFESVLRI
jgi:hypothetical protein